MDWINQSLNRSEEFYKQFNKTADLNELNVPFRSTAPGWLFQGQEITCIPDVAHPWDGAVVKAIQKIDADIVPIWVRYIYKEPTDWGTNKIHIMGRHGLGSINRTPGVDPNPFYCSMPRGETFGCYLQKPNQIEYIFKGGQDIRASDLPGKYVPFDWDVYRFVRENYKRLTIKEAKAHFVKNPYERHTQQQAKNKIETAYKHKDMQKYWQRRISEASDVETKDYFLGIGQRKREAKRLYSK